MLDDLPALRNRASRQVSPENPDGAPGGGGRAEPLPGEPAAHLGRGWKVRPYIGIGAGETVTVADIRGPATLRHLWFTAPPDRWPDLVLRIAWDDEAQPSVEAPLGDFFASGGGLCLDLASLPVAINPAGGLNCWWPMPFRRRCLMTLENRSTEPVATVFYQVDHDLGEVPDDAAYFHAQWRTSSAERPVAEHVVLDGVRGRGHYVGTSLLWVAERPGWWGEGEVKMFLDDDGEFPTICGTGLEDYVGGAWGFEGRSYSAPFCGYAAPAQGGTAHAMYRWHVTDPVRFGSRLRVTVQVLGLRFPDLQLEWRDDVVSTVAYWYQAEPHAPFPALS